MSAAANVAPSSAPATAAANSGQSDAATTAAASLAHGQTATPATSSNQKKQKTNPAPARADSSTATAAANAAPPSVPATAAANRGQSDAATTAAASLAHGQTVTPATSLAKKGPVSARADSSTATAAANVAPSSAPATAAANSGQSDAATTAAASLAHSQTVNPATSLANGGPVPACASLRLNAEAVQLVQGFLADVNSNASPFEQYRVLYGLFQAVGLEHEIPGCTLTGQQSSGKTAALCGMILKLLVGFSQNQDVGTKRPVRNIVQHDPDAHELRATFEGRDVEIQELKTREQEAMTSGGFSKRPLEKVFRGRSFVSNTQFTDTPGIVEEQGSNQQDALMTKQIVKDYLQQVPNDLVTIVRSAAVPDPVNWPLYTFYFDELRLSSRRSIVICTRALQFLRNTGVSSESELLRMCRRFVLKDREGFPVATFFVELYALSTAQLQLSFDEQQSEMKRQMQNGAQAVRQFLDGLTPAADESQRNELKRFFCTQALQDEINSRFRRLLSWNLEKIFASTRRGSDELRRSLQRDESVLARLSPVSMWQIVEKVLSLIASSCQDMVSGQGSVLSKAFIQTHGADLQKDLSNGDIFARDIFCGSGHDTASYEELARKHPLFTHHVGTQGHPATKLLNRLAFTRIMQYMVTEMRLLQPVIDTDHEYLMNKVAAVSGVTDAYNVSHIAAEIVEDILPDPLMALSMASAGAVGAAMERIIRAAMVKSFDQIRKQPRWADCRFLAEAPVFKQHLERIIARIVTESAHRCVESMKHVILDHAGVIRFKAEEEVYRVSQTFDQRVGRNGEDSGSDVWSTLMTSVAGRSNVRKRKLTMAGEDPLPVESIEEEVKIQFYSITSHIARELEAKLYMHMVRGTYRKNRHEAAVPLAGLLRDYVLEDLSSGSGAAPADEELLNKYGLDSPKLSLQQRCQAAQQEAQCLQQVLDTLQGFQRALQQTTFDIISLSDEGRPQASVHSRSFERAAMGEI